MHCKLLQLHLNQPPQSTGEWNRWNQEYRETTFNQRKEYFRDFSTKQLAEAGINYYLLNYVYVNKLIFRVEYLIFEAQEFKC